MARKNEFPLAQVSRVLKNAGAKRVSSDAAKTFSDALYDIALEYAEKAVDIARYGDRKTVKADDVKLAVRR